ncbi:MAG: hypothetical protein K0R99_3338 [Microbacterium sp.]|jgi:hypothetical protein|nr:hypothetical protein [Microbacterium sp.]
MTDANAPSNAAQAKAFRFAMPKPVRITGRSSSITNSFVNGIVPVVRPTEAQIDEALEILGLSEVVVRIAPILQRGTRAEGSEALRRRPLGLRLALCATPKAGRFVHGQSPRSGSSL